MKKLILSFSLLVLLFSVSSPLCAAENGEEAYDRIIRTGTIRCGYYPWPPYFEKDLATGELKGLFKEVYDELFSFIDLKVEYKEVTLGFQVSDLNSGKFDAICGDAPLSFASIKYVDYTHPFLYAPVHIYVKKENFEALKDKTFDREEITFATIDGDLSQELSSRLYPAAKKHALTNISDPAQALMDVVTGKANAVIMDPLTTERFLTGNPDTLAMVSTKPLAVYPVGLSVRKNEPALYHMLDMAQKMANNTGILEKAFKKYDPEGKLFLKVANPYEVSR